jgi:hypothetical protein
MSRQNREARLRAEKQRRADAKAESMRDRSGTSDYAKKEALRKKQLSANSFASLR